MKVKDYKGPRFFSKNFLILKFKQKFRIPVGTLLKGLAKNLWDCCYGIYTGQMHFLSTNQQCQNTDGNRITIFDHQYQT